MSGNFTWIESDDDFENKSWSEPENPFEYQLVLGWIYFVIVVVGFIGNIAIVIVTCTKPWRGSALSVILIALALSDILILLSTPLIFFVRHVYDIEVVEQSESLCKFVPFMIYAAQLTSAWLLVCVVLERMMNVVVTRDSITRWTQRPLVAVVVVIAIWVVCYAIDTHFLAHWGLSKGETETKYCLYTAISEEYAQFFRKQLPWFDLFVAFIVPYSISVLGSIVILNHANVQHVHTRAEQTSTSLSLPRTTFRVTLLILSITSIVTIGPQKISLLYWSYNKCFNDCFNDVFILRVLAALAHTNAAMKFYLCVISDKEFRGSLLAMVGRKRQATTYTRIAQGTVPGNDMETFNNETRL